MKARDRRFILNILDAFAVTASYRAGDRLIPRTECRLDVSENVHTPALAYFDREQVKASDEGQPVPAWVVEISVPEDRFYAIEDKTREYFNAGVKVVWELFPPYERVRVFRPLQEIEELTGADPCSAEPVLENFEMRVEQIFSPR